MNKLEDKLKNIRLRELGDADKASIWNGVLFKHLNQALDTRDSFSYISIFNLHIRKFAFAAMMLFFVVFAGGAGMISASDDAVPGSRLFSLDLAVENFQIKVAAPEEKDKLRLKFADERVVEVKTLSAAKATTVLVKALEDGTASEINTIEFSKQENAGVEVALNNLSKLVEDSTDQTNADKIEKAQEELLVILGDDANLVVKRVNGVITVDGKDNTPPVVEEVVQEEEKPVDEVVKDENPEENADEVSTEVDSTVTTSEMVTGEATLVPATENKVELKTAPMLFVANPEEEIFCRGEWRVSVECDANTEVIESGEVKGAIDEKAEIEDGHSAAEMELKVQAERARNCTGSGGIYDLSNDECLGVDGAMCTSIGGAWNECASACRNQPGATICTMQCVQVCEFKSEF